MPYIPPANRPPIDEAVGALAEEIASRLAGGGHTPVVGSTTLPGRRGAEVSVEYRGALNAVAGFIADLERDPSVAPKTAPQRLAAVIVQVARGYNQQGGWLGELNYAVTRLVQAVPAAMVRRGAWTEYLRYWLYAETVGALTRVAYDIHDNLGDDWIANGLAGVFEDIKDEYKRRVNTAYEAAQIRKSGDCYDLAPFHTQLVATTVDGVEGWVEVMLAQHEPEGAGDGQ